MEETSLVEAVLVRRIFVLRGVMYPKSQLVYLHAAFRSLGHHHWTADFLKLHIHFIASVSQTLANPKVCELNKACGRQLMG